MAKNLLVEDTKPKNQKVEDTKPVNMAIPIDAGVERFYTLTMARGQWLGFLCFTYPVAFTVNSSKAP